MHARSRLIQGCLSALLFASGCAALQIAQDVQQGRHALHIGQPATAVSYLRRAAELDPNYHAPDPLRESVLAYFGWVYYEIGNFSEARKVFEKALANDKEDHVVRFYFGLIQLRSGDQNCGWCEVESGFEGIQATLEGLVLVHIVESSGTLEDKFAPRFEEH